MSIDCVLIRSGPAGHYCVDGTIGPLCHAGYLCHYGVAVPNPENVEGLARPRGEPCPVGFYCPEGSLEAIPCVNGTFSAVTHATSASFCGPCPEVRRQQLCGARKIR